MLAALLLVACQPAAQPTPETVTVIETVVVEKEVEGETVTVVETVEVEVEVVQEVEVVVGRRGHLNLGDNYGFGTATSMDPHSPTRYFRYITMAYNRLINVDVDGSFIPELATAWESNEDATEWTITLREGVLFHDGTEMTAKDVAYSLLRHGDPELNSPLMPSLGTIQEVEIVNDYEVIIKLEVANVDMPDLLSNFQAMIIRDGGGETIDEDGIGTGPFMLADFDPAFVTEVVAFDDYWNGPPGSASASIIAISDNETWVQALLAGQVDEVSDVAADQLPLFEGNNNLHVLSFPTGTWTAMYMNTQVEPFNDPRVRKAIRLAADREELVANALNGQGTVSCDNPVWPGDQYHTEIDCPQDIEQAIALLAEAGYPDGIDIEVTTSPLAGDWAPFLETFQAQAAEAGINLIINQAPSDGYWSEVWLVDPVAMTGWGQRPANLILSIAFRSDAPWNETAYNNPDYDALLDAAGTTVDFDERYALYAQIQDLLWEDGGAFIPYHLNALSVWNACVTGIDPVVAFYIKYDKLIKSPDC